MTEDTKEEYNETSAHDMSEKYIETTALSRTGGPRRDASGQTTPLLREMRMALAIRALGSVARGPRGTGEDLST
jgi:hypothetical protein